MRFEKGSRLVESKAVLKRKKMENQRYSKGKVGLFLTAFMTIGIMVPMLTGCGQVNKDEALPAATSTVETATTMEDTEDSVSVATTSISSMDIIFDSAVGESVTFGSYEQDNDGGNGSAPIEWVVLDHQDGRTLLLSRYGLDSMWYNTDSVEVTWEESSLRRWLNTDFYNTAFDDTEKNLIVQVTNENPDGTTFWESVGRTVESSNGGNNTQDNVFLLSLYEAQEYLGLTADANPDCICTTTAYAGSQDTYSPGGKCWWWLRTPGSESCHVAVVNDSGKALSEFVYHEYKQPLAVRPAIWVGEGTHGEITDFSSVAKPTKDDTQDTPDDNTSEIAAEGCGGLYSGAQQGKYYYVWLEMEEISGIEAPMGTICLLWEGNEPYAEGSELMQDSPHNFYMGDVDDVYMIKPGWNNEDSSILTIDSDEFGKYSGKIFCFGFWLNKDDSMIYDGTALRYKD